MSHSGSKSHPTTIKIAAKEANKRNSEGSADPGPGDPSAAPSVAPQLVDIPDAPTSSQLVVKSTNSCKIATLNPENEPGENEEGPESPAGPSGAAPPVTGGLRGSSLTSRSAIGARSTSGHHSATSALGSKSTTSHHSVSGASGVKSTTGHQSVTGISGAKSTTGARGEISDLVAKSTPGPSHSEQGSVSVPKSAASTRDEVSAMGAKLATSPHGEAGATSATSPHAESSASPAASSATGSASSFGEGPSADKGKKKVTKFRYHKRITVRTKGKTSPGAIMDKVNKKDHRAGITPSTIEDMDPQELMKRAGIKANKKTHWRVRLRQTKRLTKDGKTTTQTKVAYRDSEGNKRIKTSSSPFCKNCGKKLEECHCDQE